MDHGVSVTASSGMQRWVDDASAYPRPVPARLRMLADSGLIAEGNGTFFERPSAELVDRMPTAELEAFVNRVSLDSLKPVLRLERGSDAWCYEAVAIGIAFGHRVLASSVGEISIVLDLDEERSSCVLRFTSIEWMPPHADEVDWLRMTRQQ
ncbi:MAG: hypothetical protein ACOH1T_02940 [Microbacteriaceae bacterium]